MSLLSSIQEQRSKDIIAKNSTESVEIFLNTVNDRLSTLGTYFKTEGFWWELVQIGCSIGCGKKRFHKNHKSTSTLDH